VLFRSAGSSDVRAHVTNIQQHLREIQKVVRQQTQSEQRVLRPKCGESLSEEFSDDNPYSRVVALQTLGVVSQYERIRGSSVAVVGCGGIGAVVCEILTRSGVGILSIYDRETVTLAHLSSMVFRPEHIGWSKTQVARHYLGDVNPDVHFRSFSYDIHTRYEDFLVSLRHGSIDESSNVDVVICCVDNRDARLAVNQACHEVGVSWINVEVSQTGMAATISRVLPGETACLQCGEDSSSTSAPARGDETAVHASLPSTDCVVAGLAANMALRMLLSFGGRDDHLISTDLLTSISSAQPASPPNPKCSSSWCCKRQQAKTWTQ